MATRRENVVLTLDDRFTPGMARAAAATAMLNRELGNLSGQSLATARSSNVFVRDVERMGSSARGAESSINQLTGRIRVLAEVGAVAGQTLGPLGGVAIAGVAGLASQLGFAAVAGGVLIGSLQGVGDALGAMNKAQLEPTDKNLEAAEEALKRLAPAAREFAEAAFDLKPALVAIRDMGAESLLPGITASLNDLERLGPRVAGIFEAVGAAVGSVVNDSAESLASDRWAGFFAFIEREAPAAITELATTVGSLTHGMVELWEAFTPLNDDFSSWLMNVSAGFDDWATGLSATEGFSEFIDYVRTTGPQVADTFSAIGSALVQIVQASAPLGGPVLAGIEALANVIGSIADSDLGTPIMAGVTALALLNRTLAVTASLSKVSMSGGLFAGLGTVATGAKKSAGGIKGFTADLAAMSTQYGKVGRAQSVMLAGMSQTTGAAQRTKESLGGVVKAGAGLAGLGVIATGAADDIGLTNTASLALMGSLVPGGVVIGAAAGALLDMKSAGEGATEAIRGLDAAVQSGDINMLSEQIAAAKTELKDITDLDFGGDIFDRIGFQVADTFGGPSMDEARAKIEASEKALKDMESAQRLAEGASKRSALAFLSQTGANVDLSKWSRQSSDAIKAQAQAIVDAQEAAQKTAQSFVTLGDSLNDGKVSLGDWIKQMSNSADALINFTRNSRQAAKRGLDDGLIASLQDAGEAGALRMRQLANATDAEIARANRAWRKGQKAMEEYANYKVPPKVIKIDNTQAMAGIAALEARLRAIKDEDVFVNVRHNNIPDSGGFGPQNRAADGGTVPRTGLPYADRHLYLLADGEEVISNRHGQADRHRPLLKAINGGLADGGTAKSGDKDKKKKPPKRSIEFESAEFGFGSGEVQAMLHAAEAQLNAAGRQSDAAEMAARAADDQLEAAEASQQAAEQNLENAKRQRDAFRDQVSGQFSGSLTGGGLAGMARTLGQDINAGSAMDATLRALVAAGLDTTGAAGGLFQELASSNDITTANQLLAAGPDAISIYEQQYAQRAAINANRGQFAADQSFAPMIAAQEAALALSEAMLAHSKQAAEVAGNRVTQLQGQVETLTGAVQNVAGQLADRLDNVASRSAQSSPRTSSQVGRWR